MLEIIAFACCFYLAGQLIELVELNATAKAARKRANESLAKLSPEARAMYDKALERS